MSSRRFGTDLLEATEKGYLSKPMHPNRINACLEDPNLTAILRNLIVTSSLPLVPIEHEFAPDSTGFSVSRFVRWFDEKYGMNRSGHDWVKVHGMAGTKTHIVTAVEIEERSAGDCPLFKPLVQKTAENFKIDQVAADKAYLSHENLELVNSLGATAFIPFKENSNPGDDGTIWNRMYHYNQFRREEFMNRYHRRSNVESVFSMVKAKFGDNVRSRTDAAMRNEAYCKFICHNICVVHQSHIELGIETEFWSKDESDKKAVILPMTAAK
jgi:transposase